MLILAIETGNGINHCHPRPNSISPNFRTVYTSKAPTIQYTWHFTGRFPDGKITGGKCLTVNGGKFSLRI